MGRKSKYDTTVGFKVKPIECLTRKDQVALTERMRKAKVPLPKQFKYGKNKAS